MKYLAFLIVPATGYFALVSHDWKSGLLILLTFVLIPILEINLPSTPKILNKEILFKLKSVRLYDLLLYLVVPVQYFLLIIFLINISNEHSPSLLVLKTITMGILCGVLGINVAHELGHRQNKSEQWMAQALLLTSLYMHFFIEHNRGHHKNVGTPADAATARFNESIYRFLFRCIPGVFVAAWNLERNRMIRNAKGVYSWSNQMIRFLVIEIIFIATVFLTFNLIAAICFIIAAIIGFILLESIDYIEHYGLYRREISPGIYEPVQAKHSWNCNYLIGRILLFELPLHPAHHKNSSLPYQVLQSEDHSPQMPLGYPGMILLSLWPGYWFKRINPIAIKAML